MDLFVSKRKTFLGSVCLGACTLLCFVPACSSTTNAASGDGGATADAGPAGGPVAGPVDAHCKLADGGMKTQETAESACHPAPVDAGPADAGEPDNEYGPTVFNAESDDDDCKYHLRWSSSPIHENTDVDFTLAVTTLSDGKPLSGAKPRLEVFLDETHPAPNTNQIVTESPAGELP